MLRYASGGLNTQAGPAWLDGTHSNPELVLNARDTQNFIELKDVLADMRKNKISLDKVQEAFNSAIKRRDMRCMIRDFEPCCGQLECSHYYTVGSSPSLRFYPPNAYAQCQKHHLKHHLNSYLELMKKFPRCLFCLPLPIKQC